MPLCLCLIYPDAEGPLDRGQGFEGTGCELESPVPYEPEKNVRKRGRRVAHADAVMPIPVSVVDHYFEYLLEVLRVGQEGNLPELRLLLRIGNQPDLLGLSHKVYG